MSTYLPHCSWVCSWYKTHAALIQTQTASNASNLFCFLSLCGYPFGVVVQGPFSREGGWPMLYAYIYIYIFTLRFPRVKPPPLPPPRLNTTSRCLGSACHGDGVAATSAGFGDQDPACLRWSLGEIRTCSGRCCKHQLLWGPSCFSTMSLHMCESNTGTSASFS